MKALYSIFPALTVSSVSRFQCDQWPLGDQWDRRAVLLSGTKPREPGSDVSTQGMSWTQTWGASVSGQSRSENWPPPGFRSR